jgi:predicted Zn-dependent protease
MRIKLFCLLTISLIVFACSKVPITGRRQLKLIPDSQINDMSNANYASFLKENPPVNPPTQKSAEVTAVGQRVSDAVERYMNGHGLSDRIKGYHWEFNTVNSQDVNAWCMPGGKVVVYTGILPLTKDDAGLAVVLGHEIAHAIAYHGNERMSQQLAIEAAGVGLDIFMQQKPQQTHDIFMSAFGVGSQIGVLAFSRQHELEADRLGLIFMAMAGYDPERALSFWQEMANNGGTKPPEFLSTHPSDEHRIAEIKKLMPEAKKYYQPSGSPAGKQQTGQSKQGTVQTKSTRSLGKIKADPGKK